MHTLEWVPEYAEDYIRTIITATCQAYNTNSWWPSHPYDQEITFNTSMQCLYSGAPGVILGTTEVEK